MKLFQALHIAHLGFTKVSVHCWQRSTSKIRIPFEAFFVLLFIWYPCQTRELSGFFCGVIEIVVRSTSVKRCKPTGQSTPRTVYLKGIISLFALELTTDRTRMLQKHTLGILQATFVIQVRKQLLSYFSVKFIRVIHQVASPSCECHRCHLHNISVCIKVWWS